MLVNKFPPKLSIVNFWQSARVKGRSESLLESRERISKFLSLPTDGDKLEMPVDLKYNFFSLVIFQNYMDRQMFVTHLKFICTNKKKQKNKKKTRKQKQQEGCKHAWPIHVWYMSYERTAVPELDSSEGSNHIHPIPQGFQIGIGCKSLRLYE